LIAGSDFSLYAFRGIKEKDNKKLHITSHHFDEPMALEMASKSETVLAIHGEKNER